jgi:hypothetical protein
MTNYEIINALEKIRDYAHECKEAFTKDIIKDAFLTLASNISSLQYELKLDDKKEVEHE